MSGMNGLANDVTPLYRQLAARIRRQIADGAFRPGDRLPSETELCERYAVSRITVRAAMDLLVDAGLVRRQRGKGTFVTAPLVEQELIRLTDFVEDMVVAGLTPASRVLSMAEEPAPGEVAGRLQLPAETPVVRIERLRLADEMPIAFDVTYLPLRYGHLLKRQEMDHETIYHVFETQYRIPVVSGTFLIEAAKATPEMAAELRVERGAPLLVIARTSYTEGHDPIYYQRRYYRADRVRYRVELDRGASGERQRLTEFVPVFDQAE